MKIEEYSLVDVVFPEKKPTKGQIKNLILNISDFFTKKSEFRANDYLENEDLLKGYLLYFVPLTIEKQYSIFKELFRHPKFKNMEELKVLDIGCGPSPAILPIFRLLNENVIDLEFIRYLGVESQQGAIHYAEKFVLFFKKQGLHLKYDFFRANATDLEIYKNLKKIKPDILIFSNSLGEIFDKGNFSFEDFVKIVKNFSHKNDNFTLIIIEPGTRKSSMRLHRLRDELIKEAELYPFSPCLDNLPCSALKANNWCYEERKWTAPEYLRFLSSMGLQINYMKFSYIILRKDPINIKETFEPSEEIIKNTSHLLNEKGKSRLWACWKGRLIDMEKLKRDFSEDEEWLKIRKGSYFSINKFIPISDKKIRIPRDCKIKILYEP